MKQLNIIKQIICISLFAAFFIFVILSPFQTLATLEAGGPQQPVNCIGETELKDENKDLIPHWGNVLCPYDEETHCKKTETTVTKEKCQFGHPDFQLACPKGCVVALVQPYQQNSWCDPQQRIVGSDSKGNLIVEKGTMAGCRASCKKRCIPVAKDGLLG